MAGARANLPGLRVLAAAAVLLASAAAARAQDPPIEFVDPPPRSASSDPAVLAQCRQLLTKATGPNALSPAAVSERLVALSARAVPCLFALRAEETEPAVKEAIEAALVRLVDMAFSRGLLDTARDSANPAAAGEALTIFSDFGNPLLLTELLPLIQVEDPDLRRAAKRALSGTVARIGENRVGATLARVYDSLDPEVRIPFLECVVLSGSPPVLPFITGLLGRDRRTDLLIVSALGKMAPGGHTEELFPRVRPYLADADPNFRRQAAMTLGQLRDYESIPALVHLLKDAEEGVGANAWWALRAITGLSLPFDQARWRQWYDMESRWWLREGERCLKALESSDPSEVVEAIRLLSLSTVHGDLVAARLGPLLESEVDVIRDAAAAALGAPAPERPRAAPDTAAALAWFQNGNAPAPPREPAAAAEPPPEPPAGTLRAGRLIASLVGGGLVLVLMLRVLGVSGTSRRAPRKPADGPMTMTVRYRWASNRPAAASPATGAQEPAAAPAPEQVEVGWKPGSDGLRGIETVVPKGC